MRDEAGPVAVAQLARRSNNGKPNRASSRRTMRLTAAWVTLSSAAAAVKLPSRDAASKARRPLSDGRRRMGIPSFSFTKTDISTFAGQRA